MNDAAPSPPNLDAQGLPPGYPFRPDWEITPRQAAASLQNNTPPLLVDCRTPGEWELVRLHNAIHVPLQQWSAHLESLEPHKDQPIIIYCHHGVRSLRLAMLLRQEGFTNIRSMAGGIDLWAIDVDQRLPRY